MFAKAHALVVTAIASESPKLKAATSGFGCRFDGSIRNRTRLRKEHLCPVESCMRSLTDHDWTTHGLVHLFPSRLIWVLLAAVAGAALGLAVWAGQRAGTSGERLSVT
jgi:hypothetical protein